MFFNTRDRRGGVLRGGCLLAACVITRLVISQLVLFYCLVYTKLRYVYEHICKFKTEHYACGAVSSRLAFNLLLDI